MLVACVIAAVLLANSPLYDIYFQLWNTEIAIEIGSYQLRETAATWVTDILMFFFFLFIGLEIKREAIIGELSEPRNAFLPVVAAAGGMLVPALIYLGLNPPGTGATHGWPIPMATDVALVLGVLSLFGKRVPLSLKMFLATLAIVDDIGGVMVIAFIRTQDIEFADLVIGIAALVCVLILNRLGVRNAVPYVICGLVVWWGFVESGLHPTVAGTLLAFGVPATTKIDYQEFCAHSTELIQRISDRIFNPDHNIPPDTSEIFEILQTLELTCRDAEAPLQRMEYELTHVVAFFIVPVFALANTGVRIDLALLVDAPINAAWGIILGLVVGKPLGILLTVFIAVKLGYSQLPKDTDWYMMIGVACLSGVSLTISVLLATIVYHTETLLTLARGSVLLSSLVAGVSGYLILRWAVRRREMMRRPYVMKSSES